MSQHDCLLQDKVKKLEEIIISLQEVPETVKNIDSLLVGNKYTNNKGLIDEVKSNSEEIKKLKGLATKQNIKLGLIMGAGFLLIQIIIKLLLP